jgi:hypothetical protein
MYEMMSTNNITFISSHGDLRSLLIRRPLSLVIFGTSTFT